MTIAALAERNMDEIVAAKPDACSELRPQREIQVLGLSSRFAALVLATVFVLRRRGYPTRRPSRAAQYVAARGALLRRCV